VVNRTLVAAFVLLADLADGARPYRGGAVATAHAEASEAALKILDRGGNAVDAAVAAAFVLAVVAPYHSGIGGGGFALAFDAKTGEARLLDFREVAPAKATRDMFVRNGKVAPGLSMDGALAVAVPGAARGYLELLEVGGTMSRRAVLAPAIRLAGKGFWVSPKYQQMATARLECLRRDGEASRIFLARDASGQYQVPPLAALIRQPELARTLERLAAAGPSAFHEGPIARAVAETVQKSGGVLSVEDLRRYRTRERTPLEGTYRGHRVLTMPPPSAGGLAIVQVLAAMETLEPEPAPHRDPEHLHRLVEVFRRVYVDRAKYLGDPAFVDIPLARLASRDYASALARTIDPIRATRSDSLLPAGDRSAAPAVVSPEETTGKNTTHISVVDAAGNAVALTTTVNYGFGSCLVAKGTGILLNDQMDDFAAQPMVPNAYGLVSGEANAIAPGKVPLSSMSPTIVFRKDDPKKVMLVVGSPGGSTIPTTVLQVIQNVIDYRMDLTRAVGSGRIHHQYLPDTLLVDRFGMEPETRRALAAKGHQIDELPAWGDAEAVWIDPATGLRYSASDPRNEGTALGQDAEPVKRRTAPR
jgi:gamma-glutamyltranspeptidase/glutathione hydrolase